MILNNYKVLQFVANNLDNIIDMPLIIDIQKIITKDTLDAEEINLDYRIEPVFVTNSLGENIHVAPSHEIIGELMDNLYLFANNFNYVSPLIKSSIIHFYFVYVHPFSDGNGRTGRIINVLFLVLKGLLDIPVLYLSRYIIRNKSDYYRLLQEVRTKNNWEEWILYMLEGVEYTANETINLINEIKGLMNYTKNKMQK
jgi:Fic family protein